MRSLLRAPALVAYVVFWALVVLLLPSTAWASSLPEGDPDTSPDCVGRALVWPGYLSQQVPSEPTIYLSEQVPDYTGQNVFIQTVLNEQGNWNLNLSAPVDVQVGTYDMTYAAEDNVLQYMGEVRIEAPYPNRDNWECYTTDIDMAWTAPQADPTPDPTPTAEPTPSPAPAACGTTSDPCIVKPTDASLDAVVYPAVIGFGLSMLLLSALLTAQMRRP